MADPKKPPGGKPPARPPAGGGDTKDYRDVEMWVLIILLFILGALSFGAFTLGVESFFANAFWHRFILWIKIIAGTLSLVFTVGIVYVLLKLAAFRKKEPEVLVSTEPQPQGARYSYEWTRVKSGLKDASDANAALLVIEADSLVDRILKDMKLPGETMGERLTALGEQRFESIDDLWEAHKLRNQIAHEGAKGITYGDAVWALEKYERALKKLDVI
ncbi:MAG: hypothetical protein EXS68_01920 [Candidatus Ryanbacteria bacterium]|nr:hypothetical protein [Candidatus Ryanbacteria bacterium]